MTTFGSITDAEGAIEAVRAVHGWMVGTGPGGEPFRASVPYLLNWVYIAAIDSFLRAHQRYGAAPLDASDCDQHVAETALVASRRGVIEPLRTRAERDRQRTSYRSELRSTREARSAARFLLVQPLIPLAARAPYAVLAASAAGLLARWTRPRLRLPCLPLVEAIAVRISGHALVSGVRWAMSVPESRGGAV
ncbi:oxygenase MpaB family protein [Amycolatopsis sp. NPDC004378]